MEIFMQSQKQEKREVVRRREQTTTYSIVCPLLLLLILGVAGCSGTNKSLSSAANQYNTYAGTQNLPLGTLKGVLEGGVWSLSLDDDNRFFSYQDLYDPLLKSVGSFAAVNGFLDLTLDGGKSGSGGYAIEIPGSALAIRPGDGTQYPVIAAGANSCQNPAANTTYQFLVLTLGNNLASQSGYAAYGSIQATAQGTAWSFSSFNEYAVDGTSLSPAQIPSGACVYTAEGYAVNIPISDPQNYDIPFTVAVGPTGFFIADLGQNGFSSQSTAGLVGTVKPSSQVSTSDIVAGKYAGFQYLPIQAELNAFGSPISLGSVTSPVAFGQTAGSGTTIVGGVYPNDDVSQTPPRNITIDLGQQDSQNNGLFKSVTVTIPDLAGSCISRPDGGTDANGNPTCIFPGVAVVGNPGGKYAVYVAADDKRAATFSDPSMPIEFFLYQQ
jgi:hypothetical protein